MLTRLPLPLDLNSFEVCDISHFVSYKIIIFSYLFFLLQPSLTLVCTICKYYKLISLFYLCLTASISVAADSRCGFFAGQHYC